MSDQPPALDNEDHFIDDWFAQHPNRTCYARQFRDGWTLVVKRIDQREPRQKRRSWVIIRLGPERQLSFGAEAGPCP